MKEGPDIAYIASLIGDPARANMLSALISGKALTASELANEAGITPQTASSHLRKLEDGGLIVPRRQGRHRYFALAGEQVARSLETLMELAAGTGHLRSRTGPRDAALREARVCYNHLAGQLATRLFDAMVAQGHLKLASDGLMLSPSGEVFVTSIGIDLAAIAGKRGPICRECLDWSERRSHLAGGLGRALLSRIEAMNWAGRTPGSRAVRFTPQGRAAFERLISGGSIPLGDA